MNTDEKIQKLLQMQEQGASTEEICKTLGLGSSKALSNMANRKGYRFDKDLKKYVPKALQEQSKGESVAKQNTKPKEKEKAIIERLENEIKELQKLINEKAERIAGLELELLERPLEKYNQRGAGRKQRLSDVEKESIKMYRIQGKTIKEISELYSCSVGLIHKIINEKE